MDNDLLWIRKFITTRDNYSVDVDLTYIPLGPREESLVEIDKKLAAISQQLKRAVPGVHIRPIPNKLLCTLGKNMVKIEVNGIKRGIMGPTVEFPLCDKAQAEFGMYCNARIVPLAQLYGGKIAAALSRQHPRDLFDYSYMEADKIEGLKRGIIFALLGSDKPFIECLSPNIINQMEVLENQFRGMTDIPFTYEKYLNTRKQLISFTNSMLNEEDKAFLISFEEGNPQWGKSVYNDFNNFPAVQWKLLNVNKLKTQKPAKHKRELDRLRRYFELEF